MKIDDKTTHKIGDKFIRLVSLNESLMADNS